MIDFKNYKFRASQIHLIMTGTIGCTDKEQEKIEELELRKTTKVKLTAKQEKDWILLSAETELSESKLKKLNDLNYKKNSVIGLTPNMVEELAELIKKRESKELPKTMRNELRKIWRAETYNRNFLFTNKYVQKGIIQEEEAITLYQRYRKEILKINTFFTKNTERLKNDWVSGEWDLPTLADIKKTNEGFDIKNSWSLDTFPFPEDDLTTQYQWQNRVYIWLTDAKKWTTTYCLTNGTEYLVNNEKMKHYYALNSPGEGDKYFDEYIIKVRDVEKMMIFDYERFVEVNPFHHMEITKEEWYGEGYDIPLANRVLEKTVERDESAIEEMKERITIARQYLNSLN